MGSRAGIVIVFVVLGYALLVSGAPIVRAARRRRRLARFRAAWRGGRDASHDPPCPPEPPERRDPSAPPPYQCAPRVHDDAVSGRFGGELPQRSRYAARLAVRPVRPRTPLRPPPKALRRTALQVRVPGRGPAPLGENARLERLSPVASRWPTGPGTRPPCRRGPVPCVRRDNKGDTMCDSICDSNSDTMCDTQQRAPLAFAQVPRVFSMASARTFPSSTWSVLLWWWVVVAGGGVVSGKRRRCAGFLLRPDARRRADSWAVGEARRQLAYSGAGGCASRSSSAVYAVRASVTARSPCPAVPAVRTGRPGAQAALVSTTPAQFRQSHLDGQGAF